MISEARFQLLSADYLKNLFSLLEKSGLHLEPHWDVDHICYRAPSNERYDELKKDFSQFGDLLIESMIFGRLIATYKLHKPLIFKDYEIHLVELPAPKAGKITPEGLEHIEIVCDENLTSLSSKTSALGLKWKIAHKDFNNELGVELDGHYNIKFHHLSLESVIRLEKQTEAYSALKNSQVLSLLKEYQPLLAGTYPLGLATSGSDLDILLYAHNLEQIMSLQEKLQHIAKGSDVPFVDFHMQTANNILSAKFEFNGVKFELFAQLTPSLKQNGYQHFLVEERLLKYGGAVFYKKIQKLRSLGIKTEPAFAQVLGLSGDPYVAVLQLSDYTNPQIRALFAHL